MSRNWEARKKRKRKKAYLQRLKAREKAKPKQTHKPAASQPA